MVKNVFNKNISKGCSTADLRSVFGFWGHLIWVPKFKKGRGGKSDVLHENKKLQSITLFSKLNIESEHLNTVKRMKNILLLIFLCFCQFLDKKVETSCPELSTEHLDQLELCPSVPNMVVP